jgi:hypothetical protein
MPFGGRCCTHLRSPPRHRSTTAIPGVSKEAADGRKRELAPLVMAQALGAAAALLGSACVSGLAGRRPSQSQTGVASLARQACSRPHACPIDSDVR